MVTEACQNPIVKTAFKLAKPVLRLVITDKQTKILKTIILDSTTLKWSLIYFLYNYLPYTDTYPLQFYYEYRFMMYLIYDCNCLVILIL